MAKLDELPVIGRMGSTKGKPLWFTWSGRTSSTHPDTDRALLFFHLSEHVAVRVVCTREELAEFRAELRDVESWMNGNNAAGMMRREARRRKRTS